MPSSCTDHAGTVVLSRAALDQGSQGRGLGSQVPGSCGGEGPARRSTGRWVCPDPSFPSGAGTAVRATGSPKGTASPVLPPVRELSRLCLCPYGTLPPNAGTSQHPEELLRPLPLPAHSQPQPHPNLWFLVYWPRPSGPRAGPQECPLYPITVHPRPVHSPSLSAASVPHLLPTPGGLLLLQGHVPKAPTSTASDTRHEKGHNPSPGPLTVLSVLPLRLSNQRLTQPVIC